MQCELCERDVESTTAHHLVPRSRDKKSRKIISVCKPCHAMIHRIFSNRDLEQNYDDLEKIKNHPEVIKFVAWVKKQDPNKRIKIR
jgi:hypothetical protein